MLWLRSLLFNILFYLALIVMMIVLSPVMLLGPRQVRGAARLWGRFSVWLLRVVCGLGIEVRGRENIPAGGIIVAAKHQSFWEVFALLHYFENFTFVLKRELMRIPIFGWYLWRARQIGIDRSKGRAALAKIAKAARVVLHDGGQLMIFPEGTRTAPGAAPAYKFGVGFIYHDLNVPCVPVAHDSGLFWPRRSFLIRPGTVVVEILPPIAPGLPIDQFLPLLQDKIETATNRLIADAVARDPSLKAWMAPQQAAVVATDAQPAPEPRG